MKQIPVALLSPVVFFALLFVYTKVAGPLPLSVSSVVTQKTDTFTVNGEGKASIAPDIAVVSVGVQANGTSVKKVQSDLNTKINSVSEGIKALGIEGKDIQTSNYSIYPTYDYNNGGQRITGYTASSNLIVTVHDLDKTNSVVDTATEKGANTVGGISFDVSDKTKAENEARQKAVSEATKKAEMAAQIAGFRLGKVVNYNESFGGYGGPLPYMAKAEMAADGRGAAPTQVEPGSQEVNITVSLSYELQ